MGLTTHLQGRDKIGSSPFETGTKLVFYMINSNSHKFESSILN